MAGLRSGWAFPIALQSTGAAPRMMGPMVSISLTFDDALVSFTVLQSFIRLVSMMSLWSLLVDLYGTRALGVSMLCPAFLLCYFYFYCYQSYIPFMISSKFALNIISRSLKNISTLDLYFKSSKFP